MCPGTLVFLVPFKTWISFNNSTENYYLTTQLPVTNIREPTKRARDNSWLFWKSWSHRHEPDTVKPLFTPVLFQFCARFRHFARNCKPFNKARSSITLSLSSADLTRLAMRFRNSIVFDQSELQGLRLEFPDPVHCLVFDVNETRGNSESHREAWLP